MINAVQGNKEGIHADKNMKCPIESIVQTLSAIPIAEENSTVFTLSSWIPNLENLENIHFANQINIFVNLDKYILQFEQINCVLWTNTFCNLDK